MFRLSAQLVQVLRDGWDVLSDEASEVIGRPGGSWVPRKSSSHSDVDRDFDVPSDAVIRRNP